MKKPAFRRRKYFLPNTSQPRLLLSAQFLLAAVGLIASLLLYLLVDRDLTANYFSAHIAIRNVQEIFLPYLVGINLAVFLLSVVAMVLYTHRIAGPVYRMCMILRDVAHGKLHHRVRFRRYDYLTELADEANAALGFLTEQVRDLKYQSARLMMELEKMQRCGELPSNWEELTEIAHNLQDRLNRFTLSENGLSAQARGETYHTSTNTTPH